MKDVDVFKNRCRKTRENITVFQVKDDSEPDGEWTGFRGCWVGKVWVLTGNTGMRK